MSKHVIHSEDAPAAVGPYSQGVRSGEFLAISGQLPMNEKDKTLIHDIAAATKACLNNIRAIAESGGATVENIINIVVYLVDLDDFAAMNESYAEFFSACGTYPARACVQVSGLPKNARIEMAATAHIP